MTGSATIGSTRGADAAADILAEPSCIRPVLMIPGGVLRPVRAMDQPAITDLLHDADVRRYLCDDRVLPAEAITAIMHADSQDAERGLGRWMIETANGVTLGLAGLCLVRGAGGRAPYLPGVVEPVIALYPHLWGQGLAAAALRALITHARDGLRLDRLVAVVDRPNARSAALMRRLGFVPAGTTPGPAHELLIHVLEL